MSTENGISAACVDWMRHGILLCRERLAQPVRMDTAEIEWLKWETAAREAALEGIETGELSGARLVVARYMVTMAELHMGWYGREIDDSEFYAGAQVARAAMLSQLREVTHG